MWAKLGQFALTKILWPLIERSVVALYKWLKFKWSEYKRKKKLKKDNDKKVRNYENAKTEDDAVDSYSDMP